MALSNTAMPIYYGRFREAVMRGEIPVCREISMEMNRIDDLIANPGIYYDDKAIKVIKYACKNSRYMVFAAERVIISYCFVTRRFLMRLVS